MEHLPEDEEIVNLLGRLKNANGTYPPGMLAAQRERYLKQVANVGLGIGVGTGLKNGTKNGGNTGGAASTITGKVLESVLVAAIVVEAGTAAYLYRDKLAHVISSRISPTAAGEVFNIPSNEVTENPIPTGTEVLPTPSVSVTPSVTVSVTPGADLSGDDNNGTNVTANGTPDPNGNNGNHYGLTPKPERTKDNNGNNNNTNNNGGGGNNKP